jgi:hypothetical protein
VSVTDPASHAAVAAQGAAGAGADPACGRILIDRRVAGHPDQIDPVPAPAAILPGSMLIACRVVISSRSAFP